MELLAITTSREKKRKSIKMLKFLIFDMYIFLLINFLGFYFHIRNWTSASIPNQSKREKERMKNKKNTRNKNKTAISLFINNRVLVFIAIINKYI